MLLVLQVWTCLEILLCSTLCNSTALGLFFNPVNNDPHRNFISSQLTTMSSSFECLWSTDVHNDIPDRKTYFHVFMFPCFFKVHKNVQTLFSKIYKMRLGNQFVPKWKHENMKIYFPTNKPSIYCYFKWASTHFLTNTQRRKT